jgi:hypothetical protein
MGLMGPEPDSKVSCLPLLILRLGGGARHEAEEPEEDGTQDSQRVRGLAGDRHILLPWAKAPRVRAILSDFEQ